KPVAGATVTTSSATTTTDSQGRYDLVLPVGSYQLTFHDYGYADQAVSGVQVTSGATASENAALTAQPAVRVSGPGGDGSGPGWPRHAAITIAGGPGGPVWTNPVNGRYSLTLPANAAYKATIDPDLPGYQPVHETIALGSKGLVRNISVPVDATT